MRLWLDVTLCSDTGRLTARAWCNDARGFARRHDYVDGTTLADDVVVAEIAKLVDDWVAWPCGQQHTWPPPTT